ncbi:MAG: type II toxin-antitoxin system prevent-host-death family antitoxin [bacterium]
MNDTYSITTAKAKLSAIINEVEYKHKKILIKKKGKNIAVIIPFDEFINQQDKKMKPDGLILAKNILATLEEFDTFLEDIYIARKETFERKVNL